MKRNLPIAAALLIALCAAAQGTFIYDQQSSIQEGGPPYASGGEVHSAVAPWGQSFTPSLAGVDFIRLTFDDGDTADGLGASAFLNLRSTSIGGPIIGTTPLASMPNAFAGQVNFYFPSTITLAAGTTYFFEPVISAPGPWYIYSEPHTYAGGSFYNGGTEYLGTDLWFREGIIVPEPSSAGILLLGGFLLLLRPKKGRTFPGTPGPWPESQQILPESHITASS